MTVLVNSAEGGTNGTTVTAANSGGASGNAADSVTIGATCTLAFDSAHAAHGALAYKVAYGGTAGNVQFTWAAAMGTQSQLWFRLYLYFTANPGSNTPVWSCHPASGTCGRLFVLTTGKLQFNDSAGSLVIASTNTVPLNQWFRVEGFLTGSATAGQEEFKLFQNADDLTPLETQTSAANVNTNSASITTTQFGDSGTAVANVGPYWMDDLGLSSAGYLGPSVTPAPIAAARPGQTWLRRFRHRQQLPQAPAAAAAPQAGPPVYPPGHPVTARQQPAQGGRAASRDGIFAQAGPPVRPAAGPVRARVPLPARGGQVTRRAGAYGGTGPALKALVSAVAGKLRGLPPRGRTAGRSGIYGNPGAPLTPLRGPVRAVRTPPPGGRAQGRAGTFTAVIPGSGPPVYPAGHPVQARRLPARGGRAASRAGTLTAGAPQAGPPVYPPGHPVTARRLPQRGGSVSHRAGVFGQAGPPVTPLKKPAGVYRQLPPVRGRVLSLDGIRSGTGPPAVPLRRPVRGQPQKPVLTGRAAWRAGTRTTTAFTIGALTARDAAASTLTAGSGGSALTAVTAAQAVLTGTVSAGGTDSYPDIYYSDIYPAAPAGVLTAADQRTGGPGQ